MPKLRRPRARARRGATTSNPREAALRALLAGGTSAALEAALRNDELTPRDRALFTQLVSGTLKMRRALDWSLARYLKRPADSLTTELVWVLRVGAYQLLYLTRIPPHSAVDESVKLARARGHRGTAALANAVLRKLAATPVRPPAPQAGDSAEVLGTYASLPDWLARHLLERFGFTTAVRIAEGVNQMPRRAVRVNTLVTTVEETVQMLDRAGVSTRPSRYGIQSCLILEKTPPGSAALVNKLIGSGRLSMQSEESQLAVHLLDPKQHESLLDACAGRGVKTGAIAQARPAALYALDDDATKLAALAQDMVRLNVSAVETVCADATKPYPQEVPAAFDAVLVDAPCSGIGTIGRRADLRWAKPETDPARLARVQAAILRQAARAVKPGGRLLYVTCSTDRREDEEVVDAFLASNPDFRAGELLSSNGPLGTLSAPAGSVRVIGRSLLTIPGIDGADGFFYAKLERKPS